MRFRRRLRTQIADFWIAEPHPAYNIYTRISRTQQTTPGRWYSTHGIIDGHSRASLETTRDPAQGPDIASQGGLYGEKGASECEDDLCRPIIVSSFDFWVQSTIVTFSSSHGDFSYGGPGMISSVIQEPMPFRLSLEEFLLCLSGQVPFGAEP
jgi:hypothetical protein